MKEDSEMPWSPSEKVDSNFSVPEDPEDGVFESEAKGQQPGKDSGNGTPQYGNKHSHELLKTGPQFHLILGNKLFKEIRGCDQLCALPGRPGGITEAGSEGLGTMRTAEAVDNESSVSPRCSMCVPEQEGSWLKTKTIFF